LPGRKRSSLPKFRDADLIGFLDYLRLECGLAENTMTSYGQDLSCLQQYIDDRQLRAANRSDLLEFIQQQNRKYSPATVSRRIAAVRMFYKYLCMENHGLEDPSSALERPGAWQRLPRILSPDEVERLLAAPEVAFRNLKKKSRHARALYQRDSAVLETLYATGCRASEVSSLKMEALSLQAGYIRPTGKGARERVVPLGAKARSAIEIYLEKAREFLSGQRQTPWLFLSRSGRQLDRTRVWAIVKRYLQVAGIDKQASTHTLRHSFATHMLQGGANLRAIQEMLGHASPVTTQIYTHLDRRDLIEAHHKFHPRG
jgi:integrase/recombinase XerD